MLSESVKPTQYVIYTVVSFTQFQSPHVLSGAAYTLHLLTHARCSSMCYSFFLSSLIAVQQSCLTFWTAQLRISSLLRWLRVSEYWVICIACKQCPNAGIIWLWVNQTDFLTRAVTVSDFYHRWWCGVVYIYIYIILKLNHLLTNVRVYFSTSVSEHSACKTLK